MELLGMYKNGNYRVTVLNDGTKIRETEDDNFIPSFAENCDIKITDACDRGCPFCHEGSTKSGKHGDILNAKFVNTLHPYTELAIGGGDATSHPDLIPFLRKLKEKNIVTNITVNQKHFEQKQELIRQLVDEKLIYGLGVSLVNPTDEFIELIKQYPNAVIHVINGVLTGKQARKLANNDLKMLILGYKHLRRGNDFYESEGISIASCQAWLYDHLADMVNQFKVVSFDNLAIEQLNVKRLMSDEDWNEFYMGDDGTMTFYIDMVNRKFARSSTAPFDKRYDLMDSIDDMFQKIVSEE